MKKTFILSAASAVLALSTLAVPADAQRRGTRGGIDGRDISVSTSGSGQASPGSVTLDGTADAEARNGGEVSTNVRGRTTDRRGNLTSTATARDDDERARSRTRTIVTPRGDVRSRTSTMYKERGERPVREVERYDSRRPN